MVEDGRPGATPRVLSGLAGALLVFLSSGAVLVLELSALRLLAPYLGLTLEMSTAVIGVALAAIAFGTWAGGRSADRIDPARALGPLLVAGGVLIWLVLPAVRGVGELVSTQELSLVLLMAVVTLFVPAALLSAVTPMVIRLELRDLDRTGSVVGRLSAVGTLGALLATFVTGFVLFALVPTSSILIVLGAVVLLAGAALLVWQARRRAVAVGAAAAATVGALALATPVACEAETRYHCANVVVDETQPTGRVLVLDRLRHSYVDVDDPRHLEFTYVRSIAAGIDAAFPSTDPLAVLHVGAGGMTLPRYLAQTRPGSTGRVLEIDEGVLTLVRKRMGPEPPGVDVTVGDARVGLAQQPGGAYDVVIGDAFGSVAVPWHLATKEAVEQVRRSLRPGGVYALNVIDQPPLALLRAQVATVGAVFAEVTVISEPATFRGEEGGNSVLLASDVPLPVDRLRDLLDDRDPSLGVLDGPSLEAFVGDAAVLTDDLAPVDQLLTPYVVER
ncbi:MAG: fused MFS/spermidine synthase [Jiangellales bacterium]